MAIVIGLTFPFPTQAGTDVRQWPLGVDFVGVDDDGVDWQLFYYQQDQAEPLDDCQMMHQLSQNRLRHHQHVQH